MTDIVTPVTVEDGQEQAAPESAPGPRAVIISVLPIAWLAASLIFVLLRLGIIWHVPVGGAELVHLAGAWTARTGAPDSRFVPTLFQAITTLFLHWSDSEIPARVLAYLSTATIPLAVYLVRRQLSNAGAIATLLFLSFDGLAMTLGSSASAMGFDLAVTVWLFAAIVRGGLPRWSWALVGFAVVSAGPLALPLVAAWIACSLWRRIYPDRLATLYCAAGVVVAVVLSSVRYGLGVDGLRVAPFQLFAAAYSQQWTTSTTFDLFLIYSIPVVVMGVAGAGVMTYRLASGTAHADGDEVHGLPWQLLLLAWSGFAFLWAVSSSESHAAIPLIGLTTPLAFVAGPALVRACTAMVRADWSHARWIVPIVLFIGLIFATASARWVGTSSAPSGLAAAVIVIIVAAVIAAWFWLRRFPRALPALFAIPLAVAIIPFFSVSLGVAFDAVGQPTPSPVTPVQARQLRNLLEKDISQSGGPLVVKQSLWDDLTWPLRDSGKVVVSSQIPANAGAVIWSAGSKPPDGMVALDGQWNILQETPTPTTSLSDYYRWFTNRGSLTVNETQVAVFVRPSK